MDASNSVSKRAQTPATFSWPENSSIKQCFSFLSTIIYYMAKNPSSSKVYSKTTQSCKYFFETTPILVAAYISLKYFNNMWICQNKNCEFDCWRCLKFDINKASEKSIWLTHGLSFNYNEMLDLYPQLLPKLYRCNLFEFYLRELTIEYDEFKSMISEVKIIYLYDVIIKYKNDDFVPLENILEAIPNIEDFYYAFDYNDFLTVSDTTMKNIANLENLNNLKSLNLTDIPEGLNVKDLTDFINNHKNIIFWIQFRQTISKGHAIELDQLVDDVVKTEYPNRYITYGRWGSKYYETLKKRYTAKRSRFNIGQLRPSRNPV